MTQQFKFGDLVRFIDPENAPEKEVNNLFVVQKAGKLCRIAAEHYSYLIPAKNLELVPESPWIAAAERLPEAAKPVAILIVSEEQDYCDIDAINPDTGDWINYPASPAEYAVAYWMPLPRNLLEQARLETIAAKFAAHVRKVEADYEVMVARGEAERLPDGRYQIFEKAT